MNDEDVPTGEMTSQSGQDPPEDKCNQHGWCNLLHQLFGVAFTPFGGSLFSFAFSFKRRVFTNSSLKGESADYICRKRLYELENTLGPEFMRTSKSIIVNIRRIGSVEAVFNGMMLLHMKNGSKEYVSRTYLPNLKSFLGI